MYQRILVPLDGTATSEAALPHAQALSEKFGAELILLRVVEPVNIPPVPASDMGLMTAGAVILPEMEEQREKAAVEYIQEVSHDIRARGGVVTEVEWGGAVDQIAHYAAEHQVDLIIMGTHGRHGWERLLLGSTSESLLHQTNVPVLLVKHPHHE